MNHSKRGVTSAFGDASPAFGDATPVVGGASPTKKLRSFFIGGASPMKKLPPLFFGDAPLLITLPPPAAGDASPMKKLSPPDVGVASPTKKLCSYFVGDASPDAGDAPFAKEIPPLFAGKRPFQLKMHRKHQKHAPERIKIASRQPGWSNPPAGPLSPGDFWSGPAAPSIRWPTPAWASGASPSTSPCRREIKIKIENASGLRQWGPLFYQDNSPAFQGWVKRPLEDKVPLGTAERFFRPGRDLIL